MYDETDGHVNIHDTYYIPTYIHTYIHYITLPYITLHYLTLHYITLHYITLHYIQYVQYVRTYIRTYVHTYVPTYVRTYVHTYIRTRIVYAAKCFFGASTWCVINMCVCVILDAVHDMQYLILIQ